MSLFVAIKMLILPYVHACAKFSKLFSCFAPVVSEVINRSRNTLFHHYQNYEIASHLCLFFKSPQNGGENCEGESRGLPRICSKKVQIRQQLTNITSRINNDRSQKADCDQDLEKFSKKRAKQFETKSLGAGTL